MINGKKGKTEAENTENSFNNGNEVEDTGREEMVTKKKKKKALPPSSERERIKREVAVTDERIDERVYGLYGLTEEGIRVVESE